VTWFDEWFEWKPSDPARISQLEAELDAAKAIIAELVVRAGGEVTFEDWLQAKDYEISRTELPIPYGAVRFQARRVQTIDGATVPPGQKVIEG